MNYIFPSLSLCFPRYPFFPLSVSHCVSLLVSLFVSLSVSMFLSLSVHSFSISVCLSLSLCLCLSLSLSLCISDSDFYLLLLCFSSTIPIRLRIHQVLIVHQCFLLHYRQYTPLSNLMPKVWRMGLDRYLSHTDLRGNLCLYHRLETRDN